jgi:glycosyltransferase involved in cell wall biosynthesis
MPALSAAAAALELAERFKAKTVIDIMDAWPDTFHRLLPTFLRPLAGVVFLPLHREARRIYRSADLVTGVCRRYGEMVGRFGVENYHLAYHGIETPKTLTEPRSPGSGNLRLVYAGNLGRTYDLGTVLNAVLLTDDTELDVAGAGPLESRWREMSVRLGLGERVRFHGYLDAAALSDLLSECHLGVVPMSAESFVGLPYKLCDYAKAGLGIASSLEGECAEIIGGFGVGVDYRPGDAQSLVAALRRWREAMQNGHRPDFAGMLAELDAKKIYEEYVRAVVG